MKLNWYKKAMSLDPNAWKTEATPARLRQHQDFVTNPLTNTKIPQKQNVEELEALYKGVHFAMTPEHAAIYACGKATQEDPPVIIEVDPHQMQKQPDVDAMVSSDLNYYINDRKQKWSAILMSGDSVEEMAQNLVESIENDKMDWEGNNEIEETMGVIMNEQVPIPSLAIGNYISNKNEDQIVAIFQDLISGNIPEEMTIRMVGQFRINKPIVSQRVKGIYQVPWVDMESRVETSLNDVDDDYLADKGWHRDGDEVKNENGQIIPDYEDIIYNQWFSMTPLYINKQMNLPGYSSEESVWHGTTLSRAKQAFPDLLANSQAQASSINWYKVAKVYKKKENLTLIANNYGEDKPYRIVKVIGGKNIDIHQLKDTRINASSPEEAFDIFLRNYDWLNNYIKQGFNLSVIVDEELFQKNKEKERERKKKLEHGFNAKLQRQKDKEIEDKKIQNMWWNRY